ncbi:MAG: hypothetical protein KF900_10190 [Bacteroidetes bacterium]|nr:hypothetical protein [Bacteroidota bacterium]
MALLASEIQHVLGGAFEILIIGVLLITIPLVILIAYYFTRKKIYANILYTIGGIIVLIIPLSLLAAKIGRVIGNMIEFEILLIGVIAIVALPLILLITYYYERKSLLAYILYVLGIIISLIGILIGMIGSGDAIILCIWFLLYGVIIIRFPIKRKPID